MIINLRNLFFFLLLNLFLVLSNFAQSDEAKFSEGRIAFDRYSDCQAAIKAFKSVSSAGQRDPQWILYMAKASECINNLGDAISYYEKFNQLNPGQSEIIDKLGDLRYRFRKESEETQKKQEEATRLRLEEEAKIREESRFGSLQETLNWLQTQGIRPNAPNTALYFEGRTMYWSYNCSRARLKKDLCTIYEVNLADINLDTIQVTSNGEYHSVTFYDVHHDQRYERNLIDIERYEKGSNISGDNTSSASFSYNSKETAMLAAIALRRAIRLSRQN